MTSDTTWLTWLKTRPHWWWLGVLVVLALSLRLYHFRELMIFTYDQGRDMYVLQQISRGDIKLVGPTTGLPGVFLGPFFYYALLPGFILSGGSPFGTVIWQMTVITLGLPLLYLVLKPAVGKHWALIAAALMVLAPGSIEEARVMWNPSWTVMTLLTTLACLWQSRRQPWWLTASALAFGLCLQTELAYAIFMAPVLGIWVLSQIKWSNKSQGIYTWQVLAASVVALGLTLIPQLLFEVKYDGLITRSLIKEMGDTTKQVALSQVWADRPSAMAKEMVRVVTGTTVNYQWWWLGFWLMGAWAITRPKLSPEAKTLWWLWALPLFGFMWHRGNYGYFFNYYLSPHYALTLAVLVMALANWWQNRRWRWLAGTILVLYLGFFVRYAKANFTIANFEYTAAKQIEALRVARQLTASPTAPIEVFVPNLVPVAYQYLSEWLSRTGQAEPIDFGLNGQSEYILIHEPPIGDGSRKAFEEWYQGHHQGAVCQPPLKFGITTVEHCQR